MNCPLTKQELLKQIALETSRMSYPGSMSCGSKQIVKATAKHELERYFANEFPISELYNNAKEISKDYDDWHKKQIIAIGDLLNDKQLLGNSKNKREVVAAKFLNTFMHQLMKYEWARSLYNGLHLPLDSRVFNAFKSFRQFESASIKEINNCVGKENAYSISYEDYEFIQQKLWDLIDELNKQPKIEFQIRSRIELNYFWL